MMSTQLQTFPNWNSTLLTRDFPGLFNSECCSAQFGDVKLLLFYCFYFSSLNDCILQFKPLTSLLNITFVCWMWWECFFSNKSFEPAANHISKTFRKNTSRHLNKECVYINTGTRMLIACLFITGKNCRNNPEIHCQVSGYRNCNITIQLNTLSNFKMSYFLI